MKVGFPLAHRPGKRIAGKGQKHTITVTSDSKTRITVLSCVNAAGYVTGPVKTGHICTNYTCLENGIFHGHCL